MKKIQTYLAGFLAMLGTLILAGVVYLMFIFPRTMAVWADEGRALSGVEQALANLSDTCKSFGVLLIPILILSVIGSGVWAVVSRAPRSDAHVYSADGER